MLCKLDQRGGFLREKCRLRYNELTSALNAFTNECYDEQCSFINGFAAVRIGRKWGFISEVDGRKICPIKYDDAMAFKDGFARVKIGRNWCFIDEAGNEICKARYNMLTNFKDGFAAVCRHNRFYAMNEQGKIVCKLKKV